MNKHEKQHKPHKQHHEHHEAPGYSDEVMEEAHDVIHNAELEEQKMHGKDAMCADDAGEEQKSSSKKTGLGK